MPPVGSVTAVTVTGTRSDVGVVGGRAAGAGHRVLSAVSSVVVRSSSTATGASLAQVTVTDTVAVSPAVRV